MKTLIEQQAEAWRLAPNYVESIKQLSLGGWYGLDDDEDVITTCLFTSSINGWDWRDTLQSREQSEAMNNQNKFGEVMRFEANEIPNEDLANSRGFVNDDDVGDRNEKLMPEVGDSVRYKWKKQEEVEWGSAVYSGKVEFINDDGCVISNESGYAFFDYANDVVDFMPAKTKSDKPRELTDNAICTLWSKARHNAAFSCELGAADKAFAKLVAAYVMGEDV